MQVAGLPAGDLLVQFIEGLHLGHWGEPGASEPADLALDAALLVRPFDAGVAVERVEAVVGPEQHPPRVLGPAPTRAVQHLGHRGSQVVVADVAGRDPTESLERFDVALEERLLTARRVHPVDRGAGVRQAVHEQVALGLHPIQDHPHLAEVDLRLHTRGVVLRDHRDHRDLAVLDRDLRPTPADVVPHRRIRHHARRAHRPDGRGPGGPCVAASSARPDRRRASRPRPRRTGRASARPASGSSDLAVPPTPTPAAPFVGAPRDGARAPGSSTPRPGHPDGSPRTTPPETPSRTPPPMRSSP
jgi:hypothetical protein